MEDAPTSPPPQAGRQYQNMRSTASNNWRMKDDAPRAESQPQRSRGAFQQRNGQSRPGSGYGQSTRGTNTSFNSGEPRQRQEIPENVESARLYVGNLLYTAQSSDIEAFFEANGFPIVNLSMSIDPMTGRNPSYCFVDLESVDDASRAMKELNGKDVLGRAVRINPGVARREGGQQGSGMRVKPAGSEWRRDGAPAAGNGETTHKPSFDRWGRSDAQSQWTKPQEQGKRLYVGGLPRMEPQSAVEAEMQKLFSGFELAAVSKIISPHPSKAQEPGDHYYLFVDMLNAEDVDASIEALNDTAAPWGGEGKLKINRARDNPGRKVIREQGVGTSERPRGGWRDQPAES